MKKSVFLAIVMVWSAALKAGEGSTVGNGGAGVFCGGSTQKLEMLDSYEARVLRQITFDLGPAADALTQVKFVLNRFFPVDPQRATRYLKRADEFIGDAAFIPNADLVTIPDTGALFVPVGCSLVQVAIQKQREFPDDKKFVISADLWRLMPESEKAVLILHEIIYEELIDNGASNAVGARYFNAYLSSGKIASFASRDYYAFLARFKLTLAVDIGGIEVSADELEFYPNGALKSGYGPSRSVSGSNFGGVSFRLVPKYDRFDPSPRLGQPSIWYSNGKPNALWSKDLVKLTFENQSDITLCWRLFFSETTGQLLGGTVGESTKVWHEQPGAGRAYEISFRFPDEILFHETGKLKKLKGPSQTVYQGTNPLEVQSGDGIVEFWENGHIRSIEGRGHLPVAADGNAWIGSLYEKYQRPVTFYSSGALEFGITLERAKFKTTSAVWPTLELNAGSPVHLDEEGRLIQ